MPKFAIELAVRLANLGFGANLLDWRISFSETGAHFPGYALAPFKGPAFVVNKNGRTIRHGNQEFGDQNDAHGSFAASAWIEFDRRSGRAGDGSHYSAA